jgi:imidazolonepropionase-like amidohydrolase
MNDVPEMVAITGCTVIDGNGGTPIDNGVILIDGKQIMAVGDPSTQIPSRAKRIEAIGKFVIPGLIDAGLMLVDGTCAPALIRYEGRYDRVAIELTQIALKNGITTIFDVWGPRDPLIKARDAINNGLVIGSRIYLAGNILGYSGPFSTDFRPNLRALVETPFATRIDSLWQQNVGRELTLMSPEDVRQRVREYVHSGIDFVSLAVTSHVPDAYQFSVFSPRVQQVIVEEAHLAGLPVNVFGPSTNEAIILALNAGADLSSPINIGEMGDKCISPETVALIAQREFPCGLLFLTDRVLELCRQFAKASPSDFIDRRDCIDRNVRALLAGGAVPLLRGSSVFSADTLSDWVSNGYYMPDEERRSLARGERHFDMLLGMQDKGMKPTAALMAATRNIAKAYKVDKKLGTLERGKFADLVILNRNPLENAENYRSIHLVMKEGKVIDRDALPTQRLITAQSEESE